MGNERNVFEWRRFSHWDSSAAKARFSAFVLWSMRDISVHAELAAQCGHASGDSQLALGEAFIRESAVALELIVKAVIAKRMRERRADPPKEGVPATHDLPQLWSMADLPELSPEDVYRLHRVKQTLMWSGRYATPKSVRAWEEENRGFLALKPVGEQVPPFRARTPIVLSWMDFDRLYQLAANELTENA